MNKSNKELAVDIVLEMIKANPKISYGHNNANVTPGVSLTQVNDILKSVYSTLEKLDKDQ